MTTFARVVETGSFTRAAEVLGLPKARVSQRISDLEQHLGVRLLNRTTRRLNLTTEGQAYFGKCQLIVQEIDELESALKGGSVEPRGQLRVEVLVPIALLVIAPHLHEFQARYPGISIKFGASDRVSHLLEEGIDCAIRGGQLEDSSQIALKVCEIPLGLYAAPAYMRVAGVPEHPQALAQHRLMSWLGDQRNPFAWQLERGTDPGPGVAMETQTLDVPVTAGLQFDDLNVALASCQAGGGICPAPPFVVEKAVHDGALVPVLPDWYFPARPVHILYPSNRHLTARVRCFVDWSMALMQSSVSLRLTPQELATHSQVARIQARR